MKIMSCVRARAPAPAAKDELWLGLGWRQTAGWAGVTELWEARQGQRERQSQTEKKDGEEEEKGVKGKTEVGRKKREEERKGEERKEEERRRKRGSRADGRANAVSIWPCSRLL